MTLRAILFLLTATCLPAAESAVYKVVDENGKVTFSQTPPMPKEDATATVEKVKLDASSEARSRVTTEFGRESCGKISLPKQPSGRSSSKSHLQNILKSKARWRSDLQRLSMDMEKSSQDKLKSKNRYGTYYNNKSQQNSQYQKKFRETTQAMRDLRCAIHWADGRHEQISNIESTDNAERQRLQSIFATLQNKLSEKCGEQPALDPTDGRNETMRKSWYNCSKDYVRDMNKVQNKLDRL